jgi:protein-disulfide isomerase
MNQTINSMSPKKSFLAGIGVTLAVFFVVGFFVLLSMVLKDDSPKQVTQTITQPIVQAAQPQPTDIQLAAITDEDWIKGNPEAKVSVVEFSDLECPFCKRFHPTMQRVIDEYGDEVNWVYRHFPLTSLHRKAAQEAEATECAGELGGNEGFWAYTDRLFEITPSNDGLLESQLPEIAGDVGLDKAKFTECLGSGKYADKVQQHVNDAVSAGGQGTPYSVIITEDGEKIPVSGAVPYEQIKSLLDQVL